MKKTLLAFLFVTSITRPAHTHQMGEVVMLGTAVYFVGLYGLSTMGEGNNIIGLLYTAPAVVNFYKFSGDTKPSYFAEGTTFAAISALNILSWKRERTNAIELFTYNTIATIAWTTMVLNSERLDPALKVTVIPEPTGGMIALAKYQF
ncbi:MAG: hypothetical protein V4692_13440 [Bdellovibrionota bacterium]